MRIVVMALGAAALAGCGPSGWVTFNTASIELRHPRDWYATARPLTVVDYPEQRLTIASFPLEQRARDEGCRPETALSKLGASDTLIILIEYGPGLRGFPPRPQRFGLTGFAQYECFGPSYMLRFREAGRYFQVHVAFGRAAGPEARAKALEVLDSLVVEPRA